MKCPACNSSRYKKNKVTKNTDCLRCGYTNGNIYKTEGIYNIVRIKNLKGGINGI